ncbi:restriction endonuclease [Corynebacterium propinquum]|uniref:restriction endonuclease n=1 Tax=Corynebacterium propinquum TaxID=43769 RepID=UPI00267099CE|nr:restriction endonuclease [Corynebacterium propinquum]WKS31850.1 restriction endonuclease [Corynebacterium propinquum]WKS36148.1 restriction endonuclease [Corynebacterium propinquum]WKS38319.1 restriction endonuclease [Corynebacterium propinquum]WKS42511.1 restriction endonuclease [Corynebacterium propinquum]WKS46807.1 restriction endonuclease [Corynebacterium propinquum]
MNASEAHKSFTERGIPTHQQLVVPVLKAMHVLGGSARANEITEHVLELVPGSEDLQQITYPTRPNLSVLIDRIGWARTTAKRIGVLEQPGQGMYLLTDKGEEFLELPEVNAFDKVQDLDRKISRAQRQRKKLEKEAKTADSEVEDDISDAEIREDADDEERDRDWKSQLLERLHQLSPDGFEKFVIYLLRRQGLHLQQTGGSGDEGVDAIGTAPISSVLSSRVAVQVKRYAPDKPIGRETVALFQRDAQTKGAERAIIVTLSRFTEPARKAATASIPTVDLISGDRLAELIRADGESGVKLRPTVDPRWFDKFD